MKAQDFLDWMKLVGAKSAADLITTIGLSRNTAQVLVQKAKEGEDLTLKRTVLLAMSAVAQGLKPWDEYER